MNILKKNSSRATVLFLSMLCLSCETEVDLLTNDGETTTVYALLNPSQDIQLIKVNKSFIGDVDARTLAQNPDNFNFKDGDLAIILEGYENGQLKQTYEAATYTIGKYPKNALSPEGEPGVFADDNNVVYEISTPTTDKDKSLNVNYNYRLTILNNITGEEITAETELVRNFSSSSILSPSNTNLKFALGNGVYDEVRFEWLTPVNGSRFEVYLVVNYRVTPIDNPVDTSEVRSFEILMGEVSAPDQSGTGNQKIFIDFNGERFFTSMNAVFSADLTQKYLLDPMQVKFVIGGEELNTYIQVNEPSEGLVQERPEFTNITNGLGIFSSRREFIFDGFYLENNVTAREVRDGEYTRALGLFVCHVERLTQVGSYTCPD